MKLFPDFRVVNSRPPQRGRYREEVTSETPPRRRVRLSPEVRRRQIVDASIRLIGARGFYGVSLQDVADEVGLTQPGLLHYVGSKDGLMRLLVEFGYDQRFDPADYIATGAPAATHQDGASLPGYLRYLVAHNALDRQLMRLYMVLGTEATAPEHPAYDYFAIRPDAVWELYSATKWRLPAEVGPWEDQRGLVEMALAAMDGLQIRIFREPPVDPVTEWSRYERVLFPSPVWDGYR